MRHKREKTSQTCLVCELPRKKRGLCAKHYESFRRAKAELPNNLRDQFEKLAIERGVVLPPNQGGKIISTPFLDIAKEILSGDIQHSLAVETVEKYKRKNKEPEK